METIPSSITHSLSLTPSNQLQAERDSNMVIDLEEVDLISQTPSPPSPPSPPPPASKMVNFGFTFENNHKVGQKRRRIANGLETSRHNIDNVNIDSNVTMLLQQALSLVERAQSLSPKFNGLIFSLNKAI